MTEALTTDPGYRLEYIVHEETWNGLGRFDDGPTLTVTKTALAGGGAWEFKVVKVSFATREPAIQVRVFNDAFQAFAEIPPFFAALASEGPDSLDAVRVILDRLGFVDATVRERVEV